MACVSVHPLDVSENLPKAILWMQKGSVHPKGFQKYLPHTTAGLQDGTLLPDNVAESLCAILYPVNESSGDNVLLDSFDSLALGQLAHAALPGEWFTEANGGLDLRLELCDAFSFSFIDIGNEDPNEILSITLYEKLFRRTCVLMASRIDDQVFGGRKGSFLRSCPLLDSQLFQMAFLQMTQWRAETEKRVQERDAKKIDLRGIVHTIAEGILDVRNICWECSKDATLKCTQCKIAIYCCKECQASAWKQGHKRKCLLLKSTHARLLKNLEVVEKKHETNSRIDEFQLSYVYDYHFAWTFSFLPEELMPAVAGPSMELFYKNLSRVVRKDWWMFAEPENISDVHANIQEERRSSYFSELAVLLAYDLFGSVEHVCGANDDLGAAINFFWSGNFERLKQEYGWAVPAEFFLMQYKSALLEVTDKSVKTDRKRRHRHCKIEGMQRLREEYRK